MARSGRCDRRGRAPSPTRRSRRAGGLRRTPTRRRDDDHAGLAGPERARASPRTRIRRFSGVESETHSLVPRIARGASPCCTVPSNLIAPVALAVCTVRCVEPCSAVTSRSGAGRPRRRVCGRGRGGACLVAAALPRAITTIREHDDQSPSATSTIAVSERRLWRCGRAVRAPDARIVLVPGDEPRVELVDVQLAVEAQVLGVRAQEALDVRLRRQQLELLVLERPQVLAADLRVQLRLGEVDATTETRLAQAVADLEHGRAQGRRSVRGPGPGGATAPSEARRTRRARCRP